MKKLTILMFILCHTAFASNLSKLIPHPFHSVQGGGKNTVTYIDDGIAALQLRVDMIRRAKKSIVVEYFIFNTDTAGRIISKELALAAKRGVKVRVLIDKSLPVFQFNEHYAKEMKRRGVEVRYYNAAAVWQVSSLQFRTHRKIISVDDIEAITGGRNIGDDYFDLSTHFNFDDADIHVKGPMARVMRESFDRFFEHEIAERPVLPEDSEITAKVKAFFGTTKAETLARERMANAGSSYLRLKNSHVCPVTTFSTDAPGANFEKRLRADFIDKHRFLRKTLADKISVVDKKITISSPYMIDGKANEGMFEKLRQNGSKIDIYTNSLGSTDAVYVAANMYLGIERWVNYGVRVFLHDGKWIPKNPQTPAGVRNAKSGTHSKVQVYETKSYSEVMVGTYNVDNRSNYYNTEMAVFCKGSDAFTAEVKSSIGENMQYGLRVNKDGKTAKDRNGQMHSIYGATKNDVLIMKAITLPSWLLRELL